MVTDRFSLVTTSGWQSTAGACRLSAGGRPVTASQEGRPRGHPFLQDTPCVRFDPEDQVCRGPPSRSAVGSLPQSPGGGGGGPRIHSPTMTHNPSLSAPRTDRTASGSVPFQARTDRQACPTDLRTRAPRGQARAEYGSSGTCGTSPAPAQSGTGLWGGRKGLHRGSSDQRLHKKVSLPASGAETSRQAHKQGGASMQATGGVLGRKWGGGGLEGFLEGC